MPYSIQVYENHPEASLEAGASDVLSGCDRLLRPTTDFETLRKDPKLVFQFVNDKISSVNGDKYVNITAFPPWELKHMVWVFSQSLKVSGRPQTAYHSQKAH